METWEVAEGIRTAMDLGIEPEFVVLPMVRNGVLVPCTDEKYTSDGTPFNMYDLSTMETEFGILKVLYDANLEEGDVRFLPSIADLRLVLEGQDTEAWTRQLDEELNDGQ